MNNALLSIRSSRQAGFTLIELSIVLVIIGLIVAGVLTGRSLIRAAELQSVLTDKQKYITAVHTFREKYNAIPGDMSNATTLWGTDPDGCPAGGNSLKKKTTCNGNGNFQIEGDGASGTAGQEHFRAWQQLSNAGLIDGSFTGQTGVASYDNDIPGVNIPAAKIPNTGFDWEYFNPSGHNTSGTWGADDSKQYLLFGARNDLLWNITGVALTPTDALALDKKADDGMPKAGSIRASSGYGSLGDNCVTVYQTPQIYDTTTPILYCTLVFQVSGW